MAQISSQLLSARFQESLSDLKTASFIQTICKSVGISLIYLNLCVKIRGYFTQNTAKLDIQRFIYYYS